MALPTFGFLVYSTLPASGTAREGPSDVLSGQWDPTGPTLSLLGPPQQGAVSLPPPSFGGRSINRASSKPLPLTPSALPETSLQPFQRSTRPQMCHSIASVLNIYLKSRREKEKRNPLGF